MFNLQDPTVLEDLKIKIEQILDQEDLDLAWDMLAALESALAQNGPGQLNSDTKKMVDNWIIDLELLRAPSMLDDDFFEVMEKNLADGLSRPSFDWVKAVTTRLNRAALPETQARMMQGVIPKLEHNQGKIGSKPLKVEGGSVPPTIENWLKDYNEAPNSGAFRTDIDALNYVNKFPNPNQLNPEERKQLMTLLRLYDASRNLLQAYNTLPEAKNEQDYLESLDKYRRRRFGDLAESPESDTQEKQSAQLFSLNQQLPHTSNTNVQDLLNPETQTEEQLAMTKRTSGVFVASPVKAGPAASPAVPKAPQVDIDKKLAELRSRAGIK